LISVDRSEVILRAQTQGGHVADDHEQRYRRTEDGTWTREG
jgi:hypothetical protein